MNNPTYFAGGSQVVAKHWTASQGRFTAAGKGVQPGAYAEAAETQLFYDTPMFSTSDDADGTESGYIDVDIASEDVHGMPVRARL